MTYLQEVKRYENLEPDDPDAESPSSWHRHGYHVFTTVYIGDRTQVRAVRDNLEGVAAHPLSREWWVEWSFVIGRGHVRVNLTHHDLTRLQAIRAAEQFAQIIKDQTFDSVEAFFDWARAYSQPDRAPSAA